MTTGDRAVSRATRGALLITLSVVSLSCSDKISNSVAGLAGGNGGTGGTGGGGTTPPATTRRVVGIAEVTFSNVTAATISANILIATSVADLERLRTAQAPVGNLTVVGLQPIAAAEFKLALPGQDNARFIRATFGLKNMRADSLVFDPSRENLSFVAVRTANTLGNTDVRTFLRADGSAASSALAAQLTPTDVMAVDADGSLVTIAQNILQTLSSDDVSKTTLPTGASALLPTGFVVRRFPLVTDLSQSPTPRFDGVVNFAYRFPDQPDAHDNPSTISVLFLIVDDPAARATP